MKKLFYFLLVSALVLPACTPQSDEIETQQNSEIETSESQEVENKVESDEEALSLTEPCTSKVEHTKNSSEEGRTQNVTFEFPCGWKVAVVEGDVKIHEFRVSSPDEKATLYTTKVKFGELGEAGNIEIDGESHKTTTYGMKENEMGVIVETKFGNFSYTYYTEEQKEILENIVKSVQYSGGEINPI